MKTDQLPQRVWLSLKLALIKLRWSTLELLQYLALGVTILGGYALLQRGSKRLAAVVDLQATLPAGLGSHWLIVEPGGNLALIVAGAVTVWILTAEWL